MSISREHWEQVRDALLEFEGDSYARASQILMVYPDPIELDHDWMCVVYVNRMHVVDDINAYVLALLGLRVHLASHEFRTLSPLRIAGEIGSSVEEHRGRTYRQSRAGCSGILWAGEVTSEFLDEDVPRHLVINWPVGF